jgi:hypothetical protein
VATHAYGANLLIKVGTFTPKNDIGQGTILAIGPWVAGIYGGASLQVTQEVQFRITTVGQPPKAGDDIYVRLDDIFALVDPIVPPPTPETPVVEHHQTQQQ